MLSKRSQEGWLFIDHRNSPGLPGMIGLLEAPTFTCSHCQTVVVMNPLRSRERGYCPKCDHCVCDVCNLVRLQTGSCVTFNQIIEEFQEREGRSQNTKEL